MNTLVLDIGGTAIKSALYTSGGDMIDCIETLSDGREGAQALLARLHGVISRYAGRGFSRIGVSTAGQVECSTGRIVFANDNIPDYTGMPLGELLTTAYQVPTAVENDVNAAAIGEAQFGCAQGFSDFLCLTLGTGIGGAIVIDRQVYRGLSGVAGEFGHLVTHADNGLPCTCGQQGCFEQYGSAAALVRQARTVNPSWSSGRLLSAARDAGEAGIEPVLDSWAGEVACGLASLIHCFNPPLVVLGGGILSDDDLFRRIRSRTLSRTMPSFSQNLEIRAAQLGNQAGLYGMVAICQRLERQGGT